MVSIVTIFYNRAASVAESITSLLTQEGADFEIIAIDDGSTDDTLARLRAITDPRLIVVPQANSGFTRAMNAAIALTRGRYIAVHGAGDISLPTRIARQAAILDARAEVGVVGCHVQNDAKIGSDSYVVRPPDALPFFQTLLERNLFTHGEVMFRSDVFNTVGGYREMFTFAQDRDLWLRISRHTDYAIVPEVLYIRRRFADGVSSDPHKLLLQAYASDFAVQLASAGGERDLLALYGPLAAFLRKKSPRLARTIAWTGARRMVMGDKVTGWSLVTTARAECLTRQVAMIWLLGVTHRIPGVWSIARSVLARRLQAFDR
ncbi:glycosyltransferase [Sphingomonas sp. PB2P19]|uniref:glycosyltransferase n=1 Tax=Sphingomonas rhamnosi TaxID=3096156 RepID=UPI002FC7CB2C